MNILIKGVRYYTILVENGRSFPVDVLIEKSALDVVVW